MEPHCHKATFMPIFFPPLVATVIIPARIWAISGAIIVAITLATLGWSWQG